MRKRKNSKRGGFFGLFKSKNNNSKKAQIRLDDKCYENHRGLNVASNNKSCKCYCLEKKGNKISKQLIGDTYNSCFSDKHRTENKKKCSSSKYIWSSNKKSFNLKKKCERNKSCWGK
jgi:hypothetical protein